MAGTSHYGTGGSRSILSCEWLQDGTLQAPASDSAGRSFGRLQADSREGSKRAEIGCGIITPNKKKKRIFGGLPGKLAGHEPFAHVREKELRRESRRSVKQINTEMGEVMSRRAVCACRSFRGGDEWRDPDPFLLRLGWNQSSAGETDCERGEAVRSRSHVVSPEKKST